MEEKTMDKDVKRRRLNGTPADELLRSKCPVYSQLSQIDSELLLSSLQRVSHEELEKLEEILEEEKKTVASLILPSSRPPPASSKMDDLILQKAARRLEEEANLKKFIEAEDEREAHNRNRRVASWVERHRSGGTQCFEDDIGRIQVSSGDSRLSQQQQQQPHQGHAHSSHSGWHHFGHNAVNTRIKRLGNANQPHRDKGATQPSQMALRRDTVLSVAAGGTVDEGHSMMGVESRKDSAQSPRRSETTESPVRRGGISSLSGVVVSGCVGAPVRSSASIVSGVGDARVGLTKSGRRDASSRKKKKRESASSKLSRGSGKGFSASSRRDAIVSARLSGVARVSSGVGFGDTPASVSTLQGAPKSHRRPSASTLSFEGPNRQHLHVEVDLPEEEDGREEEEEEEKKEEEEEREEETGDAVGDVAAEKLIRKSSSMNVSSNPISLPRLVSSNLLTPIDTRGVFDSDTGLHTLVRDTIGGGGVGSLGSKNSVAGGGVVSGGDVGSGKTSSGGVGDSLAPKLAVWAKNVRRPLSLSVDMLEPQQQQRQRGQSIEEQQQQQELQEDGGGRRQKERSGTKEDRNADEIMQNVVQDFMRKKKMIKLSKGQRTLGLPSPMSPRSSKGSSPRPSFDPSSSPRASDIQRSTGVSTDIGRNADGVSIDLSVGLSSVPSVGSATIMSAKTPEPIDARPCECCGAKACRAGWKAFAVSTLKIAVVVAIMIAYTLAGGFLFRWLEGDYEVMLCSKKRAVLQSLRVSLTHSAWSVASNRSTNIMSLEDAVAAAVSADFPDIDEKLFDAILHLQVSRFSSSTPPEVLVGQTIDATDVRAIARDLEDVVDRHFVELDRKMVLEVLVGGARWFWDTVQNCNTFWTFRGSVIFAYSLASSIGYGHPVAVSKMGRIVVILYGGFGIPLFLVLLDIIRQQIHTGSETTWFFFVDRTRFLAFGRGRRACCDRRRSSSTLLRKFYLENELLIYNSRAGRRALLNLFYTLSMKARKMKGDNYLRLQNYGLFQQIGDLTILQLLRKRVKARYNQAHRWLQVSPMESSRLIQFLVVRNSEEELVKAQEKLWAKYKSKYSKAMRRTLPVAIPFIVTLVYAVFSILQLITMDHWSLLDSVYFTCCSITSIGLGDYVPGWRTKATFGESQRTMENHEENFHLWNLLLNGIVGLALWLWFCQWVLNKFGRYLRILQMSSCRKYKIEDENDSDDDALASDDEETVASKESVIAQKDAPVNA